MDRDIFLSTTLAWIDSYRSEEALEGLKGFIDQSQQPEEVKSSARGAIRERIAILRGEKDPTIRVGEDIFLADIDNAPRIFTTRFAANKKLACLIGSGMNAVLVPGQAFYRIKINPLF